MIDTCLAYLKDFLAARKIPAYDDPSEASKHQGAQWARIETQRVKSFRDGTLVAKVEDLEDKTRTYRRRIYKLVLRCKLTINNRRGQAAALAEQIIAELDRRIFDQNENAIIITAQEGQAGDDPSVLRERGQADLLVDFEGGIYRDRTVRLLDLETDMELEQEISEEG